MKFDDRLPAGHQIRPYLSTYLFLLPLLFRAGSNFIEHKIFTLIVLDQEKHFVFVGLISAIQTIPW